MTGPVALPQFKLTLTAANFVNEIVGLMDHVGRVPTEGDRQSSLLRAGQRHAIDNTLFLLGAALRDASICCDARDAVLNALEIAPGYKDAQKLLLELNGKD